MKVSIILAAGEGTRMKSKKPKVLHEILGRPMLEYVIQTCQQSNVEKSVVVVGHHKEEIESCFQADYLDFVVQPIGEGLPYGTGFAVAQALPNIDDEDTVVILNGDTPLITAETLNGFLTFHEEHQNDLTILTAEMENPYGYGRIIRDEDARIIKIVEQKDACEKEKLVREINSGIFAFRGKELKDAISKLTTDNEAGELYLTDTVKILVQEHKRIGSYKLRDRNEILGVNSKAQLFICQDLMRKKVNEEYMVAGVTLIDSNQTVIEMGAIIEPDVVLYPGTYIDKSSTIGAGTVIYGSRIVASSVGENCKIDTSLLEESKVGNGTTIGPNAHLRPKSCIGNEVKIGNFVEVKNSTVGDGTKMSHLAYVGDADIGCHVNIGCGVIFVNYDGKHKFRTTVGDHAFIGSNCNLVAPVEVENYGYIAAGSTITKKVLSGQLSVERSVQKNIDGWVERKGLLNDEK